MYSKNHYFGLQLKRSIKAYFQMIVSVIAMIALSIALAWGISQWFANVQMLNRITIGVVMPEDSGEMEMIMGLVGQMDSVQSICTFSYIPRDNSFERLEDGEIQALVDFPDDFYEDVYHGKNTPLTIYFSADKDLSQSILKELLFDAIGFVQVSEASIYSVVDARHSYELKMSVGDTENFLFEYYLWKIFGRNETFRSVVLSPTGEMKLGGYYVTVAVMAFLLLQSILFGFLYKKEEEPLNQVLTLYGVSPLKRNCARIGIFGLFEYVILLVVYLLGCTVCMVTNADLFTFHPLSIIMLIPFSLTVAVFVHIIFSLAHGRLRGMLILLGINVFMFISAGGIFPMAYLPGAVSFVGKLMPLGYWMKWLAHIYFV